jgi:hypothetical protein
MANRSLEPRRLPMPTLGLLVVVRSDDGATGFRTSRCDGRNGRGQFLAPGAAA